MNPETIRLIAAYLRALLEGREKETSDEVKTAFDKYLMDRALSNHREDLIDQTLDFVPVCREWLQRQKGYFSQCTDKLLYEQGRNRYIRWLRNEKPRQAIPLPDEEVTLPGQTVPLCYEEMLPHKADGERKRMDEMEDVFQETPEQALIIKQEKKPESKRGRPPETTN
jgi:hypothetical protein